MANQDTGVSAEQLSFNEFESLPATLTIYTHGISTNVAKFHALIEALSWIAVNEPETPVDVLCDLELAVKCIKGVWKASQPEIRALCQTARQYLSRTKATLIWIPHEQNKAA